MLTRYFAFGCSYVNYVWPTITDYLGVHFDEYYNLGMPGSCNTLISSRLLEADDIYNFNPDTDFVTVGISGYGRFSIGFHTTTNSDPGWVTSGDTLIKFQEGHPYKSKLFSREIDNYDWAVYRSWVAVKTITEFLKLKNIKHEVYPSIDNMRWGIDFQVNNQMFPYLEKINNMYTIKESLDRFASDEQNSAIDHPLPRQHYLYIKKYFPYYNNELLEKRHEFFTSILDTEEVMLEKRHNYRSLKYEQFLKQNRKNHKLIK